MTRSFLESKSVVGKVQTTEVAEPSVRNAKKFRGLHGRQSKVIAHAKVQCARRCGAAWQARRSRCRQSNVETIKVIGTDAHINSGRQGHLDLASYAAILTESRHPRHRDDVNVRRDGNVGACEERIVTRNVFGAGNAGFTNETDVRGEPDTAPNSDARKLPSNAKFVTGLRGGTESPFRRLEIRKRFAEVCRGSIAELPTAIVAPAGNFDRSRRLCRNRRNSADRNQDSRK